MNQLRRVTKWMRKNRFGDYVHNHIEYGHSNIKKPTLKCVNPDKNTWKKKHMFITEKNEVIDYE